MTAISDFSEEKIRHSLDCLPTDTGKSKLDGTVRVDYISESTAIPTFDPLGHQYSFAGTSSRLPTEEINQVGYPFGALAFQASGRVLIYWGTSDPDEIGPSRETFSSPRSPYAVGRGARILSYFSGIMGIALEMTRRS